MVKITSQHGFSTIELLFSLAIFGIMLLIVIPGWQMIMGKNRAVVYANELRSALQFTQASATSLGERVIFCGSKKHRVCDGSWQDGQIVVTESGRVLRVLSKIYGGDKLIWQGSIKAKDQITFLPNGVPNGQRGHFCYSPSGGSRDNLVVILEATGRVRISEKALDGKTISCNF